MFGYTEPTYSGYTCYTGIADFVPADIDTVGYAHILLILHLIIFTIVYLHVIINLHLKVPSISGPQTILRFFRCGWGKDAVVCIL